MIVFQSRWLRLGTVWFDEQPTDAKVDVIRYQHRKEPVVGTQSKEVYTLITDLRKTPDDLLAAMTKDTRYEIRRATDRDKITYRCWNTDMAEPLARFIEFYDQCAALKNIPRAPAAYLKVMVEAGVLDLSCAMDAEGKELVWHAYYRGPWRMVLLHSGSIFRDSADTAFRNLIGRANRYLHWQDMLRSKTTGVVAYDFGGWYTGTSHQEFLRVNRFKEEFGGAVVREFNCRQLITAKAHLASVVSRMLKRPQ
jgi:lipid II:glycine glycyltransferase (peptidoglycan interpeptide bridge formation enzyme)